MTQPLPPPGDAQLVAETRDGASDSWQELVRRHGAAVTAVARARSRRTGARAGQRAMGAVRAGIVEGTQIQDAGSAPRAVRVRMIAELTGSTFGPDPTSVDDPTSLDDLISLAAAFATTPEAWQMALWHRWVEQQSVAQIAPLAGRSVKDTAALVQRAEDGVFDGYLRDQTGAGLPGGVRSSSGTLDEACASVVALLGAFERSTLSAHQHRVVADHLEHRAPVGDGDPGCADCRRRLAIRGRLPVLIPAALVPGLTGLSVERYRAAVGATAPPAGAVVLDERRASLGRRGAVFGAVAAVGLALVAAVVLVQDRFDLPAFPGTAGNRTETPSTSLPVTLPDGPAPSTTELQLRPPPTGPINRVDLVFVDGTRPLGFAPAPAGLAVAVSSPAPVFAGGSGTIDVAITNDGSDPVAGNFEILVPVGVEFDLLVSGAAECAAPLGEPAFCNVMLAAESTAVVTLRFRLSSATVGRLVVGTNTGGIDLDEQIVSVGRLLHSSVGRGQVVTIGNALMTCSDEAAACEDARRGVGEILNRWDLPMEYIGADSELGLFNSSSATLDIGTGAVDRAYLVWSGDLRERNVSIVDDGRSGQVSFTVPGGRPVEVQAERLRLGDFDASQYLGIADVTDIVRSVGPGEYRVGNVQSAEVQGSYAGWSLIVVTVDDSLPRRQLVVTTPFTWFSPQDMYAAPMPVVAGTGLVGSLDLLAFEGERSFAPERLVVGGTQLGSDSVFDSTILGDRSPAYDNNFGMDIDTYDLIIDAPDGSLAFEATSDEDGVRLAVFALTVDIP